MMDIVTEHKGFKLEHRPGIGYFVWHPGSFNGDIVVEADYKDSRNPDPEDLKYSVFITLPSTVIYTSREAEKLSKNIVEAQEAIEVFDRFLNC